MCPPSPGGYNNSILTSHAVHERGGGACMRRLTAPLARGMYACMASQPEARFVSAARHGNASIFLPGRMHGTGGASPATCVHEKFGPARGRDGIDHHPARVHRRACMRMRMRWSERRVPAGLRRVGCAVAVSGSIHADSATPIGTCTALIGCPRA
jgi:hypothetical protein